DGASTLQMEGTVTMPMRSLIHLLSCLISWAPSRSSAFIGQHRLAAKWSEPRGARPRSSMWPDRSWDFLQARTHVKLASVGGPQCGAGAPSGLTGGRTRAERTPTDGGSPSAVYFRTRSWSSRG